MKTWFKRTTQPIASDQIYLGSAHVAAKVAGPKNLVLGYVPQNAPVWQRVGPGDLFTCNAIDRACGINLQKYLPTAPLIQNACELEM